MLLLRLLLLRLLLLLCGPSLCSSVITAIRQFR
jgi:hypothetical protein